jgi:activator of HSP90 ATPase
MDFKLKTIIDTSQEEIYLTWLNSDGHSKMTRVTASISDRVGEKFTTGDGYIEGVNLELERNKRIVQSWRTSDFKESDEDSQIEILLKELDGQTELTLIHKNLSDHGEQYKKGWDDHYFKPMKAYFANIK